MRSGIVPSSRLTLISSLVLILLSGGCNAVVDFGGKIGSDDYRGGKDSGTRDGGGDPERDGGGDPERDGGGRDQDGSMPSDGSVSDGAIADGGSDGSTNENDGSTECPSQSEDCSNDVDDDCDGLRDCRDPDCAAATVCCKPNQIPETSCSGGIDNDCDTQFDCEDSDCASSELCCSTTGPEVGILACGDMRDNDCDGVVDCGETACAGLAVCCQQTGDGTEVDAVTCMDGVDNDCDGKKDCLDSGCTLTTACCTPTGASETNCTDDVDDDCDGVVDCQDSPCSEQVVCTSCAPTSTSESSCDDGVDNDCDRDRDCRDRDCEGNLACCVASGPENTSDACVDGNDNDCDGQVDCDDSDCRGQLNCCVVKPENTNESCSDNTDNDCDTKLDCADDSCQGAMTCCTATGPENNTTACADSTDNDCDGLLNCNDPDCAGQGSCPCGSGAVGLEAGCCTPDGMTEVAAPNDGKDNDCDGLIDIPVLMSAFPIEGLPASGNEVNLRFMTEINPNATLQCRSRKQAGGTFPPWATCPMDGTTARPFTADPSKPENNGLWQTDVRWSFPGGGASDVHTFRYYVHNTLRGVEHCKSAHGDKEWFDRAAMWLANPDAKAFKPGEDTFLLNPFIRVSYKTPASGRDDFQLDGSLIGVDMWSLRRRFKLSSDNRYLLITRNYRSTRTGSCGAGTISVHNRQRGGGNSAFNRYGCDAFVLNRAGAGVCLNASGSGPVYALDTISHDWNAHALGWADPLPNPIPSGFIWNGANKFMWRHIVDSSSTGLLNFTPKCAQTPCGGAIFVPDRSLFPTAP